MTREAANQRREGVAGRGSIVARVHVCMGCSLRRKTVDAGFTYLLITLRTLTQPCKPQDLFVR